MTDSKPSDGKAILREQEQALRDLGDHVAASLPNDILDWSVAHGELTVNALADRVVKILTFLRDDGNCQFTILVDVLGVDWPARPKRFDVVYHLLSMKLNQRIRIKVQTDEETPVPSVTPVFSSAGWFEREVWDMYGVMFSGHPDLRRILSDYGFEGHALRKDFPLSGYVEVRYDVEQKRVVYEPVKLQQEFRRFDFMSPWEGAQYVLPGDEKAGEGAK